jgi:hypothetical protein
MTGWYAERTPDRSAKAVIAVTLLALLLVAAVPVALLAGVVMMLLGHVVGGLALFGGSILAAAIAVAVAGMSGMRHLRKLVAGRSFRVVQLDGSQYTDVAEPEGSDYTDVVRLDRSEYTEVLTTLTRPFALPTTSSPRSPARPHHHPHPLGRRATRTGIWREGASWTISGLSCTRSTRRSSSCWKASCSALSACNCRP